MQNRFDQEIRIAASMCDFSGRLGLADLFSLFMDIAAEHAEQIGLGGEDMARSGRFWLTVRTRIRVHAMPAMMTRAVASTWPGRPSEMRCDRFYTLAAGSTLLAEGRTEWALLDLRTGRTTSVQSAYPPTLALSEETVCAEPYARIDPDFASAEPLGDYIVRSTDIDVGGHMNNVAYARALLGTFSCRRLKEMAIREMEICFCAPCFEGETLSVRCRSTENGLELAMLKADQTSTTLARLICR